MSAFGSTLALLSSAGYRTDQTGSQLYVSRYGVPVLDAVVGCQEKGVPLGVTARTLWMCCSKSVLLVPLCNALRDAGADEDSRVAEFIPEFAAGGKENVTLRHLLTHTVPYRSLGFTWTAEGPLDGGERSVLYAAGPQALERLCRMPLMAEPGTLVTYTVVLNWLLLTEILERLTGRPHTQSVREQVLEPLGMEHTSMYGADPAAAAAERALMRTLEEGREPEVYGMETHPRASRLWPGLQCRGPAREMVRPFECMAGWRHGRSLSACWRSKLLEPCRRGLGDPVYGGAELQWSLGLCADPVPFGLPLSSRVVGLTGVRSSLVFADLDTGIAVAFLSTGRVPKLDDWARKRRLVRAIYADLGLRGTDLRS